MHAGMLSPVALEMHKVMQPAQPRRLSRVHNVCLRCYAAYRQATRLPLPRWLPSKAMYASHLCPETLRVERQRHSPALSQRPSNLNSSDIEDRG